MRGTWSSCLAPAELVVFLGHIEALGEGHPSRLGFEIDGDPLGPAGRTTRVPPIRLLYRARAPLPEVRRVGRRLRSEIPIFRFVTLPGEASIEMRPHSVYRPSLSRGRSPTPRASVPSIVPAARRPRSSRQKTPHSDTHVTTSPGKPSRQVEMIFTRGKVYIQINGRSRSSDFSMEQQINAPRRSEMSARTARMESEFQDQRRRVECCRQSESRVYAQSSPVGAALIPAVVAAVVRAISAISSAVPVTVAEWMAGVGLVPVC